MGLILNYVRLLSKKSFGKQSLFECDLNRAEKTCQIMVYAEKSAVQHNFFLICYCGDRFNCCGHNNKDHFALVYKVFFFFNKSALSKVKYFTLEWQKIVLRVMTKNV